MYLRSLKKKENLRPNLPSPLLWWQQGQSWDPPERSRFWYCPWSLCFSQHWKRKEKLVYSITIKCEYFATPVIIPAHIWTFDKDKTRVKIPVEPTTGALMSSSRGEGCCWESWGVRGAGGVRAHCTRVPQLVQVVHLCFDNFEFAEKEKVSHRFRHLRQWSLLQWILARYNTWFYRF